MPLLTVSNVDKFYGAEQVLSKVTFQVHQGEHVGLVGVNGAGKSTLLRIVARQEEPDAGSVTLARNAVVAYLQQDFRFEPGQTVWEALLDQLTATWPGDVQRGILRSGPSAGADSPTVSDRSRRQTGSARTPVQSAVARGEVDGPESGMAASGDPSRSDTYRIEQVLSGMGLAEPLWHASMDQLSGGQRTRVSIARLLLQDVDLLLLDEPTNHLDIGTLEWLESYLSRLRRAFIIVAHDRYLLDRVTKRTLELSFARVTSYPGSYTRYLELRSQRHRRDQQRYERQQEDIAKTEEFIRRFRAGQRSREARGRQKQLDRLERVERPRDETALSIQPREATRSGETALKLRHLQIGYPEAPLLRLPRELLVRRGARVALVGPNGTGKTTLLRTLVGELLPLEGSIVWGVNTDIGYYAQTADELLHPDAKVLEEMQRVAPASDADLRTYLARFLFMGDDVFKRVHELSGGERSRLALARLMRAHSNVLVLDEPTNHLDIAARDALQTVLSQFPGTLIMASHDRYLIDAVATEIWAVKDGRIEAYDGGWTDYIAGRFRRRLEYDTRPTSSHGHHSRSRPDPSLGPRLRAAADTVTTIAERLAELSATGPVAQLEDLSRRYAAAQGELVDLACLWASEIRPPS